MIRVLAAIAGAGVVAAGFLVPAFRRPEGGLDIVACLPFAYGAALLLIAALPRHRYGAGGPWLAIALIGQASALQVTSAGTSVGYQHLRVPWQWSPADAVPLGFLALQTGIVLYAARDLPLRVWRWLRERMPGWRFWALVGLFGLTAATLSAEPARYAVELVLAIGLQVVMLLTVVLAARALPATGADRLRSLADRVLGRPLGPHRAGPLRPDRFAWLAAFWVLAITSLLALLVYGRHPHIPDEVAYLFHAKYFAAGRLWLEAPPVEEAFRLGLVAFEGGRWYSPVPPAWPAALAVGVKLGAGWLVNPILAALNVILAHALLGHLYGRRTARLATLLLAVSPWFLFLGMSYMTHQFSLAAALAAACCVAKLRAGGSAAWILPGGIALGAVGLTRPLEGLLVAGLLGFWVLFDPAIGLARRLGRVAALAVVTVATAAATFPYNRVFTGDPLTFPLIAYTDRVYGPGTNDLGFGPDRGLGWTGLDPLPGHGPADVLVNGNLNLYAVNVELLGWAGGSLLVVLFGALAPRRKRVDVRMMIAVLAVIGAHSFYWFSGGPDYGARYWFLILVPALALAARGLETLGDMLRDRGGPPRVHFAAVGLAALTLVAFLPWRSLDKYRDYRGMQPGMRALAAETDFGRGLVLIRGRHFPDYQSAAIYNPVDLDAPAPVYAFDASPEARTALAEAFPDRPLWVVDGPERTGAGFVLVAGPLPPGTVYEGS